MQKIGALCSKYCQFCKNLIITLDFFIFKNKHFFAENWQKSQELVIITLTLVGPARIRKSLFVVIGKTSVARFFFVQYTKTGEIYQMTIKYTKGQ
jgi:hypothetical protein